MNNAEEMKYDGDLDFSSLDDPRCPYCGNSIEDWWDTRQELDSDGAIIEYECCECEKEFQVVLELTQRFSTRYPDDLRLEEG